MSDINVSYKNSLARGTAAFEVMDRYLDGSLLARADPAVQQPVRILLGDSQTLANFTVVGFASATDRRLVKATYNATIASAILPIGVLLYGATSGASNSTIFGEVLLTGNFNAGSTDAGTDSPLVWDASFDTLAKRTSWGGLPQYQGNPHLFFSRHLIAG